MWPAPNTRHIRQSLVGILPLGRCIAMPWYAERDEMTGWVVYHFNWLRRCQKTGKFIQETCATRAKLDENYYELGRLRTRTRTLCMEWCTCTTPRTSLDTGQLRSILPSGLCRNDFFARPTAVVVAQARQQQSANNSKNKSLEALQLKWH